MNKKLLTLLITTSFVATTLVAVNVVTATGNNSETVESYREGQNKETQKTELTVVQVPSDELSEAQIAQIQSIIDKNNESINEQIAEINCNGVTGLCIHFQITLHQ